MKNVQFATMYLENGECLYLNPEYITGYGYSKERDKTVVAILGERKEIYFPGDQTNEIRISFNCIGTEGR